MHRLDTFPNNDLILQYRTTFSSRTGQAVLTHMLYELGVFQEIADGSEDIALKNYGTRLLRILASGEIGQNSIEGFVKLLLRQPLPKEGEDQ